jgi:hypothetical protein
LPNSAAAPPFLLPVGRCRRTAEGRISTSQWLKSVPGTAFAVIKSHADHDAVLEAALEAA